jgi:hypothetical protein
MFTGKPYFPDLYEEILAEDAEGGEKLREKVLKILEVPETAKTVTKPKIDYKQMIIEGLFAIGGAGSTLSELLPKIDENSDLIENKKNTFWVKIKRAFQQMMNREPDPIIYEIEYLDGVRGVNVKEKVNFNTLHNEIERKIRALNSISIKGGPVSRMQSMDEEKLIGLLDRNVRDVQSLHKTLAAMDDYFKAAAGKEDRDKVRGIKPELASIKNAIVKANNKKFEYSSAKEEAEQFKKLGIQVE